MILKRSFIKHVLRVCSARDHTVFILLRERGEAINQDLWDAERIIMFGAKINERCRLRSDALSAGHILWRKFQLITAQEIVSCGQMISSLRLATITVRIFGGIVVDNRKRKRVWRFRLPTNTIGCHGKTMTKSCRKRVKPARGATEKPKFHNTASLKRKKMQLNVKKRTSYILVTFSRSQLDATWRCPEQIYSPVVRKNGF